MITNKNNQDDWLNDDEEVKSSYDMKLLEDSFNTADFRELVKNENVKEENWNENQLIYLNCLNR